VEQPERDLCPHDWHVLDKTAVCTICGKVEQLMDGPLGYFDEEGQKWVPLPSCEVCDVPLEADQKMCPECQRLADSA
jgi:hypothetical protein